MGGFFDMACVTLLGSRNDASHKGAPNFKASRDIPSLAGKVILVTGGAGGLGRQATIELARHGKPSRIYVADLPHLAEQNTELTRQITLEAFGDTSAANVPTEIRSLGLDLGSFESVRECAAKFAAQEQQLDILILNAGVLRTLPIQTAEGHELHFGINYLGHALLARLLIPVLLRTTQLPDSNVRVVVLSSEGHLSAPRGGIDFQTLKTDCKKMDWSKRYGQSKVATIALTKDLARQYPQFKTVAVHPGRVATSIATSLQEQNPIFFRMIKPLESILSVPVTVGVNNHLWAATSPDVDSGSYYEPVGVPGRMSAHVKDDALIRKLREWTDNELKNVLPLDTPANKAGEGL